MEKLVRKFEWPEDDEANFHVYVSSNSKDSNSLKYLFNFEASGFSKCNEEKILKENIVSALNEMKAEIDKILEEISEK